MNKPTMQTRFHEKSYNDTVQRLYCDRSVLWQRNKIISNQLLHIISVKLIYLKREKVFYTKLAFRSKDSYMEICKTIWNTRYVSLIEISEKLRKFFKLKVDYSLVPKKDIWNNELFWTKYGKGIKYITRFINS